MWPVCHRLQGPLCVACLSPPARPALCGLSATPCRAHSVACLSSPAGPALCGLSVTPCRARFVWPVRHPLLGPLCVTYLSPPCMARSAWPVCHPLQGPLCVAHNALTDNTPHYSAVGYARKCGVVFTQVMEQYVYTGGSMSRGRLILSYRITCWGRWLCCAFK